MIVILDYEVGNVKSVWNALNRIGMEAVISNQIDTIEKASGIILPGVGSFSSAMKQEKKLTRSINQTKTSRYSNFRNLFRNANFIRKRI